MRRNKSFRYFLALLAATATSTLCCNAHADEKYAPAQYWLLHGYKPVRHSASRSPEHPGWPAHSLKWPVPFQDSQHEIGNSMAEFQSYGDGPYYHGGCDLRVKPQQTVVSPISGKLEAGHYGYTNNPDGSSTKFWTPWPGSGESVYFEVAVVSDDGYRFEFHHMDESALPDPILKALTHGGGRVQAGQLLGQVIFWPDGEYHHTHVNIYTPSGVQLNPEYYYELIGDHVAPQIQSALAVMPDSQVVGFGKGEFTEHPSKFVLAVNDQLDDDAYVHPPVLAGVEFDSGEKFVWDFHERLLGPDGKFPPIWSFFVEQITDPNGQSLTTDGGYGTGLSVIQIPVPQAAQGPFTVEVGDQAGNMTRVKGRIVGFQPKPR